MANSNILNLTGGQTITISNVSGETPFTNPPAGPITGDKFVNSTDGISWIYDGATWQEIAEAKSHYQDNTGSTIPGALVDPTIPITPSSGDYTLQEYDDGVVHSIYQGGVWINTSVSSAAGGTDFFIDQLSTGSFTATVTRLGGTSTTPVTLTNPSAGHYEFSVPAGVYFQRATVFYDNTTGDGAQEIYLEIDNSANGYDRRFTLTLKLANTGALVDQQAFGMVHYETTSGNVTTILIPGTNANGAAGFYCDIA